MSAWRPPAPPGQAGPADAAGADSHCRPPRSKPGAPRPPAPVTPSDPGARLPRSAAWARAGRHLHFGDSAVGKCLHRAVESQSGSRRLLASGQLPKLRQPDSPREGRAGIWVSVGQRVKLTAAAATSHPTPTPRTQAPPPRAGRSGWQTRRRVPTTRDGQPQTNGVRWDWGRVLERD